MFSWTFIVFIADSEVREQIPAERVGPKQVILQESRGVRTQHRARYCETLSDGAGGGFGFTLLVLRRMPWFTRAVLGTSAEIRCLGIVWTGWELA